MTREIAQRTDSRRCVLLRHLRPHLRKLTAGAGIGSGVADHVVNTGDAVRCRPSRATASTRALPTGMSTLQKRPGQLTLRGQVDQRTRKRRQERIDRPGHKMGIAG